VVSPRLSPEVIPCVLDFSSVTVIYLGHFPGILSWIWSVFVTFTRNYVHFKPHLHVVFRQDKSAVKVNRKCISPLKSDASFLPTSGRHWLTNEIYGHIFDSLILHPTVMYSYVRPVLTSYVCCYSAVWTWHFHTFSRLYVYSACVVDWECGARKWTTKLCDYIYTTTFVFFWFFSRPLSRNHSGSGRNIYT